jgi:diacylglycerol kinase (ATP)
MSGPYQPSRPAAAIRAELATRTSVLGSLSCAMNGLAEAATRERNLRIHIAAGVLASCFAAVAPLSQAERGLLLLCVVLVVAAEAANTALENVVDLVSPGWDDRARSAKDCAAGAVLVVAAGSVLVFVTVAGPVLSIAALRAHAVAASAALGVAAAAGVLPMPFRRHRAADVALALGGLACLLTVARAAESPGALSAAALLLGIAGESARRARRGASVAVATPT